MRLSIVVPAHNEETRIGGMLDAYLPYFDRVYGSCFEIIVVLNACTDNTEAIVDRCASRYSQLRHVTVPLPGKGRALIRGFQESSGELVGFVDADGATPPEAFHALVESIGSAGAVIASRWQSTSVVSPRQPMQRRIASRCFNLVVRVLFGLRLTDTQCGAKLMRGDALKSVLPRLGVTRWAFDVDLLFQFRRAGFDVTEVPTVWCDVSGSKLKIMRASVETLVALVRLRLLHSPLHPTVALWNAIWNLFWIREDRHAGSGAPSSLP
jgi:glycosyltransferase involved in cell wall biosynthesis